MPETAPSLFSRAKHGRPSLRTAAQTAETHQPSVIHHQSNSGSFKDLGLSRLYKHLQSNVKPVGKD